MPGSGATVNCLSSNKPAPSLQWPSPGTQLAVAQPRHDAPPTTSACDALLQMLRLGNHLLSEMNELADTEQSP
jgi:hypothetical protein